jgi:hypothetical protein
MSAAPIVALTDIRVRAIDQVSHEKPEMRVRACPRGTPALRCITGVSMVENGSAQCAPKRSADISMVRYGIASQSTAQK